MIMEEMGKLCDAVTVTKATEGLIGYCLDLAQTTGYPGNAQNIFVQIKVNTVATGASGDYVQFKLVSGSGSDGTDINAGELEHLLTTAYLYTDTRLLTAGNSLLTCTLPVEVNQRYIQFRAAVTDEGASFSMIIDASILPAQPKTPDFIQVTESPVGVP
jgi:hypothetical protein